MSNFSNDGHLLKWEPDVFRLCRFPQQKLGAGSTGATSAGSANFTDATNGDFVNAGVDAGHVAYLSKSGAYDDYFAVKSRLSGTQLELDAPKGIFTTQSGIAWSVYTFDPQHEEAHFELLERFDISDANALNADESEIFDARVLRRASAFRVLEMIFRAQATSENDLFWQKAERYRTLYERALAAVRLRFDLNADGEPDETKDAGSVDLRVEESGDAWPPETEA
jgi:hypothetical protein